jgi:hypothetical protein
VDDEVAGQRGDGGAASTMGASWVVGEVEGAEARSHEKDEDEQRRMNISLTGRDKKSQRRKKVTSHVGDTLPLSHDKSPDRSTLFMVRPNWFIDKRTLRYARSTRTLPSN